MYTIEFNNDYAELQVSGLVSIEIFMAFARELLNSRQFRQGMHVLVNYTKADGFSFDNFKYSDVERFASLISKHREALNDSKLATVTINDMESKAVVSLFESITNFHGLKLNHREFHKRSEALAWLLA